MKYFLPVVWLFIVQSSFAQTQTCPLNNNFSFGNLTHWQAYTGNNINGNPATTILTYDSSTATPSGTLGNSTIYEYNLPGVPAIQILSTPGTDPYGKFPTIPTINGYKYTNSILLGSTSITRNNGVGLGGGYVRGVSYRISVPPGPADEPYTMTYAYAMILENGTHNSAQQPLFLAKLTTNDSVISCASPQYFLPTLDNADSRGSGAILDSVRAKGEGFYLSDLSSPNANPNGQGVGGSEHLRDVWAKGWTEVTFDLSPWRGQQVVLTFETDNCVPGGHFAYSYIALRNTCAGLVISGPQVACIGSTLTYSVPGLTGATYQWSVPGDWSIVSGTDTSVLKVKIGNDVGTVAVHEANSCADLKSSMAVTTSPPTIAGAVSGGVEVCTGTNSSVLTLSGNLGSVLNWLSSTDGVNYTIVNAQTPVYTAQNLTSTTIFKALVQNGESCDIDTSGGTTMLVDPLTVGGKLTPPTMEFCLGQNKDALLTLTGEIGKPVNWQSSTDAINWTDFTPVYTDSIYSVVGLTGPTRYRVLVQSGVCPAAYSDISNIDFVNVPFPQSTYSPADTLICYNTSATLNSTITVGTDYAWSSTDNLLNAGNGVIAMLPYSIEATATPPATTQYVLSIENAGCPNLLKDTFLVQVLPPILVDAGNDTAVVINQPLQLHASSNDTTTPAGDAFLWTPAIGLNDPTIADPIGMYSNETDSVTYLVKATSGYGCTGYAKVQVRVFKTDPDIFVPNAFTPGGPANTIFRPIAPGIASLQYFMVYNRWGQLMYRTSQLGQGWDGQVNGRQAQGGGYVWVVQGTTYTGKVIYHRGTMVLVR
ncbi:MAG TPA: gliding motility-associated C-terminal domain-containing protein [Puia sp.]|jgi:gliding motility-associated-like protein